MIVYAKQTSLSASPAALHAAAILLLATAANGRILLIPVHPGRRTDALAKLIHRRNSLFYLQMLQMKVF
jgi:hypothetical protein